MERILALGQGRPMTTAEARRILRGDHAGWEEIGADETVAEGEEVYPILRDDERSVRPCVVSRTGTLKNLLVGLPSEPVRVFRRKRLPARKAPSKNEEQPTGRRFTQS